MTIRTILSRLVSGVVLAALPLAAAAAEPYQALQLQDGDFRERVLEAQEYQGAMAEKRTAIEAEILRARMENVQGNWESDLAVQRGYVTRAWETRRKKMDGFPGRVREAEEYQRQLEQKRMEAQGDGGR